MDTATPGTLAVAMNSVIAGLASIPGAGAGPGQGKYSEVSIIAPGGLNLVFEGACTWLLFLALDI